jgi:hypothetical protein
MKKNFMLLLVFFVSSISIKSYAQIITAYSFGIIGNLGDKSPQYSNSVDIQGSECFIIASGIKTLFETSKGEYINTCEVDASKINMLTLNAYPNPISTLTHIKFSKQQYITNDEKVLIQLFNQKGNLVQQSTINLSQLNSGFDFQLDNILNNGVYFLKASNPNKVFKILTLLKQD